MCVHFEAYNVVSVLFSAAVKRPAKVNAFSRRTAVVECQGTVKKGWMAEVFS
jgi:hypothetical protein